MVAKSNSFAADVDKWCQDSIAKCEAVFREAAEDVIDEMQKVGPSVAATNAAISRGLGHKGRGKNRLPIQGPVTAPGEGGRNPVDLGWHRASLKVALDAGPQALTQVAPESRAPAWDIGEVSMTIKNANLDQKIVASYGMVYSRRLEYGFHGADSLGRYYNQRGYFFVRSAAQKWQQIVAKATERVKARWRD